MDLIKNIESFEKLTAYERIRIFNNEIKRIDNYIYKSSWYLNQSPNIKSAIQKNKPWMLYKNVETNTPVRLYGYAIDEKTSEVIYLVATMEDDESNSISFGQIYDIERIKCITWKDIDSNYVKDLKKAESYGGDMIFLKPEMFIFLGQFEENKNPN